ncbi:MAG: hypothetical protein GXY08_09510 [Ruminococcus sp.]|nr:hypothetical protein [Ruminococcus sp.]
MSWKYITPEVIRSGKFVAKDIAQYEEAVEYNKQMTLKQPLKYKWYAVREIYMLLNVIAYLMALCLYLKPIIFKGVGGINIAAALIAGAGYFYLLWRYIIPDAGDNNTIIKVPSRSYGGRRSFSGEGYSEIRTGASLGTIASFIIGFIMVAVSVVILKDRPTINSVVSFGAIVACTLMMVFYVFVPDRWNIAISIAGAGALFLVNPVVSVYALLIVIAAVFSDIHGRRAMSAEGYPDFTLLVISMYEQGSKTVSNYDDFNRYDGIDDEMESI